MAEWTESDRIIEQLEWVAKHPDHSDLLCHAAFVAWQVIAAIPDKDDPLGWVQEVQAKRMGVPTPSEALQMQVTINRELQAEIDDLRALRDAIPGDDKLAVAEWSVAIAKHTLMIEDIAGIERNYWVDGVPKACPPSVRAALTQSKES